MGTVPHPSEPLASGRVLRSGGPAAAVLAVAGLIALCAAAAAAGWLLRGAVREPTAAPAAPRVLEAGSMRIAVDPTWTPAAPLAGVAPGTVRGATLDIGGGQPARAILTVEPFADATLLPGSLRALASGDLPAPRRVRMLGLPAWRYSGVPVGRGAMEVTVVPTTAGALAVACVVADATWSTSLWCDGGVRGIDLAGAAALLPEPALAVRAGLPGEMDRLNGRRAVLRARLERATTRRGQARLSARLARAYTRTITALAPRAAGTTAGDRLFTGMKRTSAAYTRLMRSARANRPRAFGRNAAAVRREEAEVGQALASLVGRT